MPPNIQAAYNWAVETCAKPNVGYSQQFRNEVTVNGITYYDCSSFVWFALKAGGFAVVEGYMAVYDRHNGRSFKSFRFYKVPGNNAVETC